MTQQDLPSFDPPPQQDNPVPPRKPRPKPTRARKVATPAKKRRHRKVTAKKTLVVSGTGLNVAQIIMAHAQIEALLAPLSKTERKAMLGMFNK